MNNSPGFILLSFVISSRMTVDFTRCLSREALARRANPMKEIRRLVLEADRPLESFTSLSNGDII